MHRPNGNGTGGGPVWYESHTRLMVVEIFNILRRTTANFALHKREGTGNGGPSSSITLCSRGCIAKIPYLVMCALHTGCLPANNLRHGGGEISAKSLLISLLGVVFALLHRFQNGFIASTQVGFRVDPGPVHGAGGRSGNLLVRFAEPRQLRLQFLSEPSPLHTLLVEIALQIGTLHMLSGVLIAFLAVSARLNEFFHNADSIVLVHDDFLLLIRCARRNRVWQHSHGGN